MSRPPLARRAETATVRNCFVPHRPGARPIQPSHTALRGRLTAERTAEIYAAVIAELPESGYERLSFDKIAEAAHCSKATLYRRWDGKLDLVVSALSCEVEGKTNAAAPETGSLRGDLRAWADAFVADHAPDVALVLGLARACLEEPELAKAMHHRVVSDEANTIATIVRGAVERGEVAPDVPALPHVLEALAGPALLHDILTGAAVSASSLHAFIDAVVLPALGVPVNDEESTT